MPVIPKGTPLDQVLAMLTRRSCGECQACCVAFAVSDMRKIAGQRCPAQAPEGLCGGCKIYAVRPRECASFTCMWLDGLTPEGERPDRVGYVLTAHRTRKGQLPMVHLLESVDERARQRIFGDPPRFPLALRHGVPWAVCVPDPSNALQRMELHLPDEMSEQEREDWLAAVAELDQDL